MNSTTLVTVVALVLGLLLACGGSVLLANARAADRDVRRWHATITPYPAALSALLGFLLSSVAGAVLCWRLVPFRGASGVLVAIATGVVLFAVVGAGFARVADQVETRRLHGVPDEVHRPISPAPPRRPALPPAPPAPPAPPGTVQQALPAPPATPAPPPPAPPAKADAMPRDDPLSTRLVEVRRPAPAGIPPEAPEPAEAPKPLEAPPPPILDSPQATASTPAGPTPVAGWMYHDDAGRWFLAVGAAGTASGAPLLLGLPAFALVDPAGPDAPFGALRMVGAAELTVQPEPPPPAEPSAPTAPTDRRTVRESTIQEANADDSIPVQRSVDEPVRRLENDGSLGTGPAEPAAPLESRPGFTHAHSRSASPSPNAAPERGRAEEG